MKRKRIGLCMLALLGLGTTVWVQSKMNTDLNATASFQVPSFSTYEKIRIAKDTYTVISEENGTVKALMDTTVGNSQTWEKAHASANSYFSNIGTLGSNILTGTYRLPLSTDLTAVTEANTLNASIPQVTNDWWLGDASVDNRSKFMTNDNSFEGTHKIELADFLADNTCGVTTKTETGIMPTENFKQVDVTKHVIESGKAILDLGFPDIFGAYGPVYVEAYSSNNCTGTPQYVSTFSTHDFAISNGMITDTQLRVSSLMTRSLGWMPEKVGDSYSVEIPAGKKCYDLTLHNSSPNNQYNSFIILESRAGGVTKYLTKNVTFTATLRTFQNVVGETKRCEGKQILAGTASLRPMIDLPTQTIAFANTNKRTYAIDQEVSSLFPVSDTGNNKPYLTLKSNKLNVSLDNTANGVDGTTYKTEIPSTGIISIPVAITGGKEGTQYVSAKATSINGVEQYGVLKEVSGANDTIQINLNHLFPDFMTRNQISLTLYVEDTGIGDTAYISDGTDITVQFSKPQTIAFDQSQPSTLIYGDTITLHASTTSTDFSTEPLIFSINDASKATITEQNYNRNDGTASATITPKTGTGSITVMIEKAGDENVSDAQAVPHTIHLQPKAVTVKAVKPSKIYAIGEAMPVFISECNDLVSNDTLPDGLIPSLEPLNGSAQRPDQNGKVSEIGIWKLVYPSNILDAFTDFTNKYNVTLYDYDDETEKTLCFETSIKVLPESWISVTPNANVNGWNQSAVTIAPTQTAISAGFTDIEVLDGNGNVVKTGKSIVYNINTSTSGVTPNIRLKKGNYTTDPRAVRTIKMDLDVPTVSISVEKEFDWATKKLVTVTATDVLSGVDTITVEKDGTQIPISNNTFTAQDNGVYNITVTDKAGNSYTEAKTITKIDTTSISMTATPETVTIDVPRQKITIAYQAGSSGIKTLKVYYKAKVSDSYIVLEEALDQTKNPLEWYAEMNGIFKFELVNNAFETISDEVTITSVNPPVPVTQISAYVKDQPTIAYTSNTWTNKDILLNVTNVNTDIIEAVSWQYSEDNGSTWKPLNGTSLEVSEAAFSTKTIQFKGSTSKAKEQSPKSYTVKIDKTGVDVPEVQDKEKYTRKDWYASDVTLSVNAKAKQSKVAQIVYACEGTQSDCETNPALWTQTNGTKRVTGNGTHEVYFKSIDEAGNESNLTDPIYVNINSTVPQITIKIQNDPVKQLLNNATLGFFFKDIVSIDIEVTYGQGQAGNVYYILEEDESKPKPTETDQRWVKGSSTHIIPDAKGKVYVKAVSDAGVIAYDDSVLSVYADQTPPVITLPKDMVDWTNQNHIIFQMEDVLSGIDPVSASVQIDNDPAKAFTPGTPDSTISSLKDGMYGVSVSISDYSGNTANDTVNVKIDTTAPVIGTPTADISGLAKEKSITFTLEDMASGIEAYTVTDAQGDSYTVSENADGSYSFVIYKNETYTISATDIAGNENTVTYTEFNIDTEVPAISNIVVNDANVFRPKKTVTFEVSDALSGVKDVMVSYVKDGQTYNEQVTIPTTGNTYSFVAKENTEYTIKAVDNAGNEDSKAVQVEQIDTTGIRIVDISDFSTWSKDTMTISFSVSTKAGIANGFPKVLHDGQLVPFTTNNGRYEFIATENGIYEIQAEDQAGLDISEALHITRIDKGTPVIDQISNNTTASDWRGPQTISFHANDTESGLKQGYPKVSVIIDGVKKSIKVAQDPSDSTLFTFLAEYNGTYVIEAQDVVEHPIVVEHVPVDHILTADMMTPIQVSAMANGKNITSGTWVNDEVMFTISGGLDASILEKYQVAITNGTQPAGSDFIDLNVDASHHEVSKDTNGHVYWFRAYPLLSNTISTPFTVNIDSTPPNNLTVNKVAINANPVAKFIHFMSAGLWMNEAQEVSFTATDNFTSSNDIKYQYYEEKNGVTIGQPVWKPYTGSLTYRDVDITLHVKAIDLAGNESSEHPEPLQIDSVPPIITGAKDRSEYKYYYVPRYITVTDEGSQIDKTSYKKDGGEEVFFNNEVTLDNTGIYEMYAVDQAGNEKMITFSIVPLPPLADITGSDASKDIIDQIQRELDEVKGKIDDSELENYEKWVEDATTIWKGQRKDSVKDETTGTIVEGSEGITFDPETILVVKDIPLDKLPSLPKGAYKAYDVALMKDNVEIEPLGKITVRLPYANTEAPVLYEIQEDGTYKEITYTAKDGYLIFETDQLKEYVLAEKKTDEPFVCSIEDGEILNKDTDGDGRPDLNIDYDGDCVADLNVDTDNDGIPDLDIDIDGDGQADYNIDTNKDGSADENIIKIEKWIPDKDCEYKGFKYDTMSDPTKKTDEPTNPDDVNNPTNPDDQNKQEDPNKPDPSNPSDANKDNTDGSSSNEGNGNGIDKKVNGVYTSVGNGIGGASTGEQSNISFLLYSCLFTISCMLLYGYLLRYKRK